MAVMDEFKEEREAMKNASFKEKLKYFWYYYKFHTIAVIAVMILVVTLVYDIATQKDTAFFGVMLNSAYVNEEAMSTFQESFVEYAEIDSETYDVQFDHTINLSESAISEVNASSSQRLLVYTSSAEIDVMVGGADVFPEQANQGMFYDLRDILTEEQIAKYESRFFYVDQAYIDLLDEIYDSSTTTEIELPEAPEPTKPQEMEQPIPVGIFVTDCEKLTDAYFFVGDYCVVGVMGNAPHLENAITFIDYLFE